MHSNLGFFREGESGKERERARERARARERERERASERVRKIERGRAGGRAGRARESEIGAEILSPQTDVSSYTNLHIIMSMNQNS
jgi:hypothetical protein